MECEKEMLQILNHKDHGKFIIMMPFIISSIRCSGTEELLSQCTRTTETRLASEVNSYCYQHSGDAGVECNVPDTCSKEPEVLY